ncbi:unnamed protein product [Kuraishia capsulata CBS 1993]|uniref:Actin-related protein 4 n=1 Tax=Kuraishia capsulata CBS 1993 TaxID=1382522 RepID=W6MMB3_9ASCO|nr:uncharacterized protein KUCA_T00003698001 [Kuraishia capsulata CBS 1993]CDK27719.1 unnamed protein product [Kuraishia capsulata CBS 1993]
MSAAPQIYGADEISAIVLDPGSYTTKVGYAGHDSPLIVSPSYYGEQKGDVDMDGNGSSEKKLIFDENSLYAPKENFEIKPILKNNMIEDWDGAVEQWKFFFGRLDVNPADQPLLITESTLNSYSNKAKAMEVVLEDLQFCAFSLVNQPTCVSFAHGRPNCLVVDIGHDLVTCTPVVDGICLKNQVMGVRYAGAYLNQELTQVLRSRGIDHIDPLYKIKAKNPSYWSKEEFKPDWESRKFDYSISKSFDDFHNLRVLQEMKESLLQCTSEIVTGPDTESLTSSSARNFELPNGLNVPFSQKERCLLGNSIFSPEKPYTGQEEGIVEGWEEITDNGNIVNVLGGSKGEKTSKEYVPLRRSKKGEDEENEDGDKTDASKKLANKPNGLTEIVNQCLLNLDIDLKPQLANNIILSGSTSLIPGLGERLNQELTDLNPGLKIRIHSVGNPVERKYASWVGGSILASLGTFHQLWVSKKEYEEVGAERLVVSRFR